MGKDKNKQLKQLLAFVKELYDHPDNTEFADGIRELVLTDKDVAGRLNSDPGAVLFPSSQGFLSAAAPGELSVLDRVEKYLSLDYELDRKEVPDYSFVTDDNALAKLVSDFREMMRFRYGTRYHRVDFLEFCRFAALQVEMLVNYYYDNQYPDVYDIITTIQSNNPRANLSQDIEFISEIPLKTKLFQLTKESKIGQFNLNTFLRLIDVRNRQSHRSLIPDKDLIRQTEDKLKKAGAWTQYDTPDESKDNPQDAMTKAEKAVGKKILTEYKIQLFMDRQPYDEVMVSLKKLAAKVRNSFS